MFEEYISCKYVVRVPFVLKSLKTSQFKVISGILESKSKNYQRYHKNDIFQLLRPNSRSVTKIKWNWCPTCQDWQKIYQSQAISRVPENSWKFQGMMKGDSPESLCRVMTCVLKNFQKEIFAKIGKNKKIKVAGGQNA